MSVEDRKAVGDHRRVAPRDGLGSRRRSLATVTVVTVALVLASCGGTDQSSSPVARPTPSASTTTAVETDPSITVSTSAPALQPPFEATSTETPTTQGGPSFDASTPVEVDPWLGANPALVTQGLGNGPIDCQLPLWSDDPAAAESYYRAAIGCHDQSWAGVFAQLGFEFSPAALWAGAEAATYQGACADSDMTREAFYCSQDSTIVMPFDTMSTISQYGEGYALAVLSHEYGHHLQRELRILDSYGVHREDVGRNSDAGLLLSRQLELQAWCFSGMFYGVNTGQGSITQQLSDDAFSNNSQAGDRPGENREHGTNDHIAGWFSWGRQPSADPSAPAVPSLYECNTWAARDAGSLE